MKRYRNQHAMRPRRTRQPVLTPHEARRAIQRKRFWSVARGTLGIGLALALIVFAIVYLAR